jgi:hypothetical protein
MEILSGLGNAGAFRLKRTWADISPRHKSVYDELKALMAPERNFFAFREQLKSVNPPTIPYIGATSMFHVPIEAANNEWFRHIPHRFNLH